MRILIIDDDVESVRPLQEELRGRGDYEIHVCDFDAVDSKLREVRPALVVLDLLRGGVDDVAGNEAYQVIWNVRFCPIVVYSAHPGLLEAPTHPYVRSVTKGMGSEPEAADTLEGLRAAAEALQQASDKVDGVLHRSLARVAPALPHVDPDVLARVCKRQLAATLDFEFGVGESVFGWEQFIYPSVYKHLATGDLIRVVDTDPSDPSAYRIILTPTCDLVASETRTPKVTHVLVAACGPITELEPKGKKLERILQSQFDPNTQVLVIPQFDSLWPHMIGRLRSLELVQIADISTDTGDGDYSFIRVASVDSPFRELVTWCYLQVAGRPGVPERDLRTWAEEIDAVRGTNEGR